VHVCVEVGFGRLSIRLVRSRDLDRFIDIGGTRTAANFGKCPFVHCGSVDRAVLPVNTQGKSSEPAGSERFLPARKVERILGISGIEGHRPKNWQGHEV
jgi:hypothetical protein